MGRILALDIGGKRTGLAETDPLGIIASPLPTVETQFLLDHLKQYHQKEKVETFVLGDPKNLLGGHSDNSARVADWAEKLATHFPGVPVILVDERFTSKMASEALLVGGAKKKDRQNKALVDQVSAVLILQSYLSSKR